MNETDAIKNQCGRCGGDIDIKHALCKTCSMIRADERNYKHENPIKGGNTMNEKNFTEQLSTIDRCLGRIKMLEQQYRLRCDDNMKLCLEIDTKDAEIQRLTESRDMWKSRALLLDGKYQNWVE